jgi:hypothetical protein
MAVALNRTKDNPWKLKTAPGTSEYTMHVDEKDGKKILVCTVGSTVLHYDARCVLISKMPQPLERHVADSVGSARQHERVARGCFAGRSGG